MSRGFVKVRVKWKTALKRRLENVTQDGSILRSLNSKKSLGNDPYPRTITKANNVLSNHNLDTSKAPKQQKPNCQQN